MTHQITPQALLPADTVEALKADIKFIISTRGPLRGQILVRAHFYNRLMALKAA